jgi:hypothetical protein
MVRLVAFPRLMQKALDNSKSWIETIRSDLEDIRSRFAVVERKPTADVLQVTANSFNPAFRIIQCFLHEPGKSQEDCNMIALQCAAE